MAISASELRSNVYRLLDEVIETGRPLEIDRKGRKVRVVPVKTESKLSHLARHTCIQGDPEELVHIDWSETWTGGLP